MKKRDMAIKAMAQGFYKPQSVESGKIKQKKKNRKCKKNIIQKAWKLEY